MIPTPTPYPIDTSGFPVLEFPRVWDLAPDAIQTWNNFGNATTILQIIILCGIIGLGVFMLYRFLRRLFEPIPENDA